MAADGAYLKDHLNGCGKIDARRYARVEHLAYGNSLNEKINIL